MTKDEAKDLIVQVVTEKQGAKATVLAAEERLLAIGYDFPDLVEELVDEDRLVEVEYVLPDMNYRCKSFLLPKGSKVRVKNGND